MPSSIVQRIVIFALTSLAGCDGTATRVHVEISSDPTWALDGYQLRVGPRVALSAPLPALDLVVPDDTASHPTRIEVWGLSAGRQIAYGTATVTPALHTTITSGVTLDAVSCGTLCTDQTVACTNDGTITCAQTPDGCFAWSDLTPCPPASPYCSNGTCGAVCSDECAMNETRCDSAVAMRSCGQFDSDSCLDWSGPIACASGATCSNGACLPATTCAHDGDPCDDGNGCTEQDTCEGSACVGTAKACPAPPDGDPTCTNGTCGFTCRSGYTKSGASCVPTPKRIFITSTLYTGALGGLAGADAKCQAQATAAGLAGTFKAWLSSDTTSAASRLSHASVPYVLVDGTVVATDWAHLVVVPHAHGIDRNETGSAVNGEAWTHTSSDGTIASASCTDCSCANWTSEAPAPDGPSGGFGESSSTGKAWTAADAVTFCDIGLRLYCVEQ